MWLWRRLRVRVPNSREKFRAPYGGSIENRARFLLEVVGVLIEVWSANRVGVCIAPGGRWNGTSDSDPDALFDYVAAQLNRFGAGYLHIIEPRTRGNKLVAEGQPPIAAERLRKIFTGTIIAARGFEPETAEKAVESGVADVIAFGKHFVANPDLPKRIRLGLPLNPYDRSTFYTFDVRGYTDYPFYEELHGEATVTVGDSRQCRTIEGKRCVEALKAQIVGPPIDSVLPFSQVAEAHRRLEDLFSFDILCNDSLQVREALRDNLNCFWRKDRKLPYGADRKTSLLSVYSARRHFQELFDVVPAQRVAR